MPTRWLMFAFALFAVTMFTVKTGMAAAINAWGAWVGPVGIDLSLHRPFRSQETSSRRIRAGLSGAADTGRDLPDRLLTDLALGTFPIKRLPRVIRRALVSHPRKCLIRRHPDARPSDAAMREAEQRQQRVPRAACDLRQHRCGAAGIGRTGDRNHLLVREGDRLPIRPLNNSSAISLFRKLRMFCEIF